MDPTRQGQGVGSNLLQPVLVKVDAQRTPCYLETAEPKNVPFYRKHEFQVIIEDTEPSADFASGLSGVIPRLRIHLL